MTLTQVAPTPTGEESWRVAWTPTFALFMAYIFCILTYRASIASEITLVAIATLFLQRTAVRAPAFLWWFGAWLLWAGVGYTVTPYPEPVWDSLIEHGKILLVALVAVNAVRTETQVRHFMLFMLVTYLLFPARSTLLNYVTGNTLFGRAIGPAIYKNPNDLAAITILMLGPALALWAGATHKSLVRWIALAGAAPLVIVIVLTQSRGAVIALAAMALPSALALVRRRPRTVLMLACLVAVALRLAPSSFWDRIGGLGKATNAATISEMDPEGSAKQRFAVLQNALHIARDHPVLGIGMGAYGEANRSYNRALGTLDTHNTYLNILAETGLPGLVLFLALVGSVLRSARETRRRAGQVFPAHSEMVRWLQYGLVGHLIAGVFGSYSKLTYPYVFLALLWSTSQALRARLQQARTLEPSSVPDPVLAPLGAAHGRGPVMVHDVRERQTSWG